MTEKKIIISGDPRVKIASINMRLSRRLNNSVFLKNSYLNSPFEGAEGIFGRTRSLRLRIWVTYSQRIIKERRRNKWLEERSYEVMLEQNFKERILKLGYSNRGVTALKTTSRFFSSYVPRRNVFVPIMNLYIPNNDE